jgi:threonine synthase
VDGARGVTRYQSWLGVSRIVSLGEPQTPVLEFAWGSSSVLLKLEGSLPSGSFKDRGTAVLFGSLVENGITRVVEDSSGNAGASFAAYAAACDIELDLFVPASASPAKLLQARAHGAHVHLVEGHRRAATEAAVAAAARDGGLYASHQWQPAFNLGTQTFAFELWEQLGCRAPDVVVCPVGAGGMLLGVDLGFRALHEGGLVERRPRVIGVQSTACAPLARAIAEGSEKAVAVDGAPSIAEGVLLTSPPRAAEILAAVRGSKGTIVATDDHAVWTAHEALRERGVLVELTSALPVAALAALHASGEITSDDTVVIALTGHGLKSAGQLSDRLGVV